MARQKVSKFIHHSHFKAVDMVLLIITV